MSGGYLFPKCFHYMTLTWLAWPSRIIQHPPLQGHLESSPRLLLFVKTPTARQRCDQRCHCLAIYSILKTIADQCSNACMHACMHACMYMHVCPSAWMHVCMYTCMYRHVWAIKGGPWPVLFAHVWPISLIRFATIDQSLVTQVSKCLTIFTNSLVE